MKYYHTINANNRVELVNTQADSKAAGVKKPVPFEVPNTDKEKLRLFLNELYAQIDPLERKTHTHGTLQECVDAHWPDGLEKPDSPFSAVRILMDIDKRKDATGTGAKLAEQLRALADQVEKL
jgi:hypothetical protein